MKKLLMLSVLLALCMFAVPVLAQPEVGFTLSKTCVMGFVKAGEDATFSVIFANTGDVDLIVVFDEDLTGTDCPAIAGTPVTVQPGNSLTCQVTKTADTDTSTSRVDNTVNAHITLPESTGMSLYWDESVSASCHIYGVMSGTKWNDMNADHLRDQSEPVLSGWKIHFYKKDFGGSYTFDGEEVTGADGSYANDMIRPGFQYAVCEVLEPTYVQTYPNVMAAGYVDCTQFGSGYGPIGYDIIMSSGEYDTNNNFGNWVPTEGCGYTWGYWKNHNVYSKKDEGTWDKVPPGAEDSQFFDNWADPPVNSDALTWYEILKIPPKKSNAYVILSDQYVAAWLNIQKDVDPANPAVLGTAMADAESLLTFYSNGNNDPQNPSYIMSMYPPTIPRGANHFTSDDLAWAMELASMLDQFNRGALAGGPVYCGDKITLF